MLVRRLARHAARARAPSSACAVQIAVEGCCHGELDAIYDSIRLTQQQTGVAIDVLIICGDFQAVRNQARGDRREIARGRAQRADRCDPMARTRPCAPAPSPAPPPTRRQADLSTMACPPKYRSMASFYKYYSGEKVAPVLTIVIGGNHEASNHMWELYYGGWLAPNIYFLGRAEIRAEIRARRRAPPHPPTPQVRGGGQRGRCAHRRPVWHLQRPPLPPRPLRDPALFQRRHALGVPRARARGARRLLLLFIRL